MRTGLLLYELEAYYCVSFESTSSSKVHITPRIASSAALQRSLAFIRFLILYSHQSQSISMSISSSSQGNFPSCNSQTSASLPNTSKPKLRQKSSCETVSLFLWHSMFRSLRYECTPNKFHPRSTGFQFQCNSWNLPG